MIQRRSLQLRRPATPCSLANQPLIRHRHQRNCLARVNAAASSLQETRHIVQDNVGLEVLYHPAEQMQASSRPPLLFIHGSYHAAWCWKENFMPYFATRGYSSYALSLRGQGNSDPISAPVAGTLDTHAADIADFISTLPSPPVVISHSFGGLIMEKYVLGASSPSSNGTGSSYPALAGAAFLCSVPPSGNKQLVMRFLRKDLWLSLKVTWGFIAKSFAKSTKACQELFFSKDIPQDLLAKYQRQLAACSPTRLLDLQDMTKQVPLPAAPATAPPAFVLGGEDDCVVDVEAVRELAEYYGVLPVVLPGMAHDCMLDTRWQVAAAVLESWLSKL